MGRNARYRSTGSIRTRDGSGRVPVQHYASRSSRSVPQPDYEVAARNRLLQVRGTHSAKHLPNNRIHIARIPTPSLIRPSPREMTKVKLNRKKALKRPVVTGKWFWDIHRYKRAGGSRFFCVELHPAFAQYSTSLRAAIIYPLGDWTRCAKCSRRGRNKNLLKDLAKSS